MINLFTVYMYIYIYNVFVVRSFVLFLFFFNRKQAIKTFYNNLNVYACIVSLMIEAPVAVGLECPFFAGSTTICRWLSVKPHHFSRVLCPGSACCWRAQSVIKASQGKQIYLISPLKNSRSHYYAVGKCSERDNECFFS